MEVLEGKREGVCERCMIKSYFENTASLNFIISF